MAAIVAAGAGVPVIKHGNRSASSKAGAADVLEVLGVRLDLAPDQVKRVAEDVGISFCFAPAFHPALRHAAVARKELAVATVFNFLGPLANPGAPAAQAIGCADPRMAPIMAGVFARRGVDAWVFRGDDGLDELTTTTTSRIWQVTGGGIVEVELDPADVGLPRSQPGDLRGGDARHNAAVVRRVLAGEQGPVRDAVLLNAGAAIAVHTGGHGPLVEQLAAGVERARDAVDSGAAERALNRWVEAGAAPR
jgi:anthranilate phosphoribosyltransferase